MPAVKPLGKAAKKAVAKNDAAVEELVKILYRAKSADVSGAQHSATIVSEMRADALEIARVTRRPGGARLEVTLQDGTKEASVRIGGAITIKGRASTKEDRANCMCVGDVIVVRGGIAAGKLSQKAIRLVKHRLEELQIKVSPAIFAEAAAAAAEEDDLFDMTVTKEEVAAAGAGGGGDVDIDIEVI
jgi:type II secretory pathway component PulM